MHKYLLVDADNLLHRAFHAIPPSTSPQGLPNNALKGLTQSILSIHAQFGPFPRTFCAFDSGSPEFRKSACPDYKKNRKEKPPELQKQLLLAKTLLIPSLGWNSIHLSHTEADDLIYGLCIKTLEEQAHPVIASGDKDIAQCLALHKNITLLRPSSTGWQKFDQTSGKNILGVECHQIPDFLALCGDQSDNLTGIPGVGPKTAQKWLEKFGSIKNLLENIHLVEPKRFQTKINQENLEKNLQITQAYNPKINLPPQENQDPHLKELLALWGLQSLIPKICP